MVTTLRSVLERPALAWGGGVLMMVAGPTSNEIGGINSLTLDADDLRADSRPEPIDGPVADRGVDAGAQSN